MKNYEELKNFSVRLKSLRKRHKIKQSEIANFLDCTENHYQKIEYGQVNIHAITLMILADYFGVTTDYLLGRSDEGGPDAAKKPPDKSDGEI